MKPPKNWNAHTRRVRANLDLDVRGACVRRKKRSQLTPCIPYKLFSPSAQIGQSFGIFLKKQHYHMSIVRPWNERS